jgi:hypothetical protein
MKILLQINMLAPKRQPNKDVNPTVFFIDVILMFKFFPGVCIVQIWDLENFRRNDLKQ